MVSKQSAAAIVRQIPAIGELGDDALREAVVRSWLAAIERSPYASLADVPQSPSMAHRPLLKHVNEVNARASYLYRIAIDEFGLSVDHDVALATAILHDLDKPLLFRIDRDAVTLADGTRPTDHGTIGAAIAREHGVPDRITELVRVHSPFASVGLPGTPEGTIVHYADFIANDFAAISVGREPAHSSHKWVAK